MLRSESLKSNLKLPTTRRSAGLCLVIFLLTMLPSAFAQADFTLQAAPFSPTAINPGGTSSSNITLGGSSTSVELSCQVTPTPANFPGCQVSPATVVVPGGAVATITTNSVTGSSPPGLYSITITGTDSSGPVSVQQNLTVLAVTPQFTVTVGTAVAPSSVHAGSGGQGTVNVNPINGYTGNVTLSCASITPLVTIPPICSFSPAVVPVVSGVAGTSVISISTVGPIAERNATRRRSLYVLWLPLPMLALTGLGAAVGGKRSRRAWGLLALFVLGAWVLLMPACGNNNVATTNVTAITPMNSYTFTLIGVDANGVTSSNTGTTTASPTVTLTVN
jgi:hypothetical protein